MGIYCCLVSIHFEQVNPILMSVFILVPVQNCLVGLFHSRIVVLYKSGGDTPGLVNTSNKLLIVIVDYTYQNMPCSVATVESMQVTVA